MFEIIALPNPSQLKESSVNDAMDTPKIEVNFSKYKKRTSSMLSSNFEGCSGHFSFKKFATDVCVCVCYNWHVRVI